MIENVKSTITKMRPARTKNVEPRLPLCLVVTVGAYDR